MFVLGKYLADKKGKDVLKLEATCDGLAEERSDLGELLLSFKKKNKNHLNRTQMP